MKLSELRAFIRKSLEEAKVSAGSDYMKKEVVRQRIQEMVSSMVNSGDITTDAELAELFSTMSMAINALKMVPLAAYVTKTATKKKK